METIDAIAGALARTALRPKWLVAPSRRAGNQWLAVVCRRGQPVINTRVTTTRALALALAAPELDRRELSYLGGARRAEALVDRVAREAIASPAAGGRRYLLGLTPSAGLSRALARTIADLRLAGVTARQLVDRRGALEAPTKAAELARLLEAYEAALSRRQLVDHADVCALARRRLEGQAGRDGALSGGALVLLPAQVSAELHARERAMLAALPAERLTLLDDDEPSETPARSTDVVAERERFCALGEVNEIREVLRRCQAEGRPFDDVELLHTDAATYVPLIYELLCGLTGAAGGADPEAPPVTFAEGLPLWLLRPGRALRGWLAWREGRDPRVARRLARAGLIEGGTGGDDGPEAAVISGDGVLVAAWCFVAERARARGRLDRFAQRALLAEIEQARLDEPPSTPEEAWRWLAELPERLRVGGEAPRPGQLHVASLWSGGHSGRPRTFVVGLDDGRLPGGGPQDPLLLDGERSRLSPRLGTTAALYARRLGRVQGTLAHLARQGPLTLSHSDHDLTSDRELFAAPAVLGGDDAGGGPGGPRASFAARDPRRALDAAEWWQGRLHDRPGGERAVGQRYAHLGRGLEARAARASDRFTAFDGHVPEAGHDLDPSRPADGRWRTGQPVLAATPLERLGRSPFDYFCRHVLGISPPPEPPGAPDDEGPWLDAAARGALLHEIFFELMQAAQTRREQVDPRRHLPLLERIVARKLADRRARRPPTNLQRYEHEAEAIRRAATIFLVDEARWRELRLPFCFEAAIGARPTGAGTPLDTESPGELRLPSGRVVRARGKVDRVDLLAGRGLRFAIWDYKTASSFGYRRQAPFAGGRRIQGALYLRLTADRLRAAISPRATVERFGYFFPTVREHGLRVEWSAAELAGGPAVIDALCDLLAAGCFPCSEDPEDLRFSDYLPLLGAPEAAARSIRRKLENGAEPALEPLRRLRAVGAGEGAR